MTPERPPQRFIYPYSNLDSSPAPVLFVNIGPFHNRSLTAQHRALLDTGANRTFVPSSILREIGSRPFGPVGRLTGSTNGVMSSVQHKITLQICSRYYPSFTVWSWDKDVNFILVGRDLLNECSSSFNGPGLSFELIH